MPHDGNHGHDIMVRAQRQWLPILFLGALFFLYGVTGLVAYFLGISVVPLGLLALLGFGPTYIIFFAALSLLGVLMLARGLAGVWAAESRYRAGLSMAQTPLGTAYKETVCTPEQQAQRRIDIWKDTEQQFLEEMQLKPEVSMLDQAERNRAVWRKAAGLMPTPNLSVVSSDWGVAALERAQKTGQIYAVLNMANAYVPGGGYLRGKAAQEENMYRRTNAAFRLSETERANERYSEESRLLINGMMHDPDHPSEYMVSLDVQHPLVCIKGPEVLQAHGFIGGYEQLKKDEYFMFYELKSAAVDLRHQGGYRRPTEEDHRSMQQRIRAQLHTLKKNQVRHVILSAFGCGAFGWDAKVVAAMYKEALNQKDHQDYFQDIVFAIYYPGYGPENYPVFHDTLSQAQGMSPGLVL